MDITEVAKQTGLPASTLRYYEEKGLIASIGRQGLRRVFHPNVLQQLALITLGRSAGFSLDEIAPMLEGNHSLHIDRQRLLDKADELEQFIHRLTFIRDQLRSAATCPEENHLACPNFQQLMTSALSESRLMKKKRRPKANSSFL